MGHDLFVTLRVRLQVLLTIALLLAACGADPDLTPTTGRRPTKANGAWPTAGRDLANTRSDVGSQITTASVDRLSPKWRARLPGAGALTSTPIVSEGVVYVAGGAGQVYAID